MRSIFYYLLGGPAFFLPFSYFCLVLLVIFFPGADFTVPHTQSLFDIFSPLSGTVHFENLCQAMLFLMPLSGLYLALVQWPIYLAWAAFAPNINLRIKIVWLIFLFFLNMLAIPIFLYAMYVGEPEKIVLSQIRNLKVRAFLEGKS